MSNDFFNHSTNIVASGIRALAAHINNVANEIATGFDKLPTLNQLKYQTSKFAVDTGAANAYVVTLPFATAPFALTDGMEVHTRAVNANTGASTINVNALGAKSIVFNDGNALTAGAIPANADLMLRYDSANDRFVMVSSSIKYPAISQTVNQTVDALWTFDATDNFYGGTGAAGNILAGADGNTIIGHDAARALTTGDNNVAVGNVSGDDITTGGSNVAVGFRALDGGGALTGAHNIAIGTQTLGSASITGANDNTAIGRSNLTALTDGAGNIAIGTSAGTGLTTGDNNIILGGGAGVSITGGIDNICIGRNAGPTGDDSNRICIDSGAAATNVPMIGGDASANTVSFAPDSTTVALQVDNDGNAGNTRLLVYDVDNATLERVSVGAADSGGSGFKVLRILN